MARRKPKCKGCEHLDQWDLRCVHGSAPQPNMITMDDIMARTLPGWCPLAPTPQDPTDAGQGGSHG